MSHKRTIHQHNVKIVQMLNRAQADKTAKTYIKTVSYVQFSPLKKS